MKNFLLDTHIVTWHFTNDRRLDKNIRHDIDYFMHSYSVSIESLKEIMLLKKGGKINFPHTARQFEKELHDLNIDVVSPNIYAIRAMEKLNINFKSHSDPADLMIISQAISMDKILISADRKFDYYRSYGLELLKC